jgi:hypothetical protein
MADPLPVGRVVPPGEFRRLVDEELAKLVEATARDVRLLTQAEIDALRTSARRTVESRLRGAAVVPASRQRVQLGVATDLWDSPTVRAVQAADELDEELRDVRAEFRTKDADVDPVSALVHQKACVVLAASRRPMDEQSYLAALNAVSEAPASGRGSDPDLERHLESAAALSDLAEARLRERGIFSSADGYDDQFVAEVAAVTRKFGLSYYERGA